MGSSSKAKTRAPQTEKTFKCCSNKAFGSTISRLILKLFLLVKFETIICLAWWTENFLLTDSVQSATSQCCCCSEVRMKVVCAYQLLFLLLKNTSPTPIVPSPKEEPSLPGNPSNDWCQLYPELGGAGTVQFLEDCNSTDRCPESTCNICINFDVLDLNLCRYRRRWS